jgi:hypothetical protein
VHPTSKGKARYRVAQGVLEVGEIYFDVVGDMSDILVRVTRPGYNNFSLSLSDKLPVIVDPAAGEGLASEVLNPWRVVAISASSNGIVLAGIGAGEPGVAVELVPLDPWLCLRESESSYINGGKDEESREI